MSSSSALLTGIVSISFKIQSVIPCCCLEGSSSSLLGDISPSSLESIGFCIKSLGDGGGVGELSHASLSGEEFILFLKTLFSF